MSNEQTLASYDSAPNSLLAFNVLQNHRLDLDLFRGGYFRALGGQYAFTEAANGHLTSAYPIGVALVTLPLYAVFYLVRGDVRVTALDSPRFEPLRQQCEKTVAAAVAAFSVGLFFLCALEIGNFTRAAIATAVYAVATSTWSISSQALWQHGPVNVLVLAVFYALVRASPREPANFSWWLPVAGVLAGLLPVVRPTAVFFSIAALLFVGWIFRNRSFPFVIGLALGVAPGVAWNVYFFHSLLGGYGGVPHPYVASPSRALIALTGLLVSPSRGILTFSPVLVFSVGGFFHAWRVRDRTAILVMLFASACAALVVQYAFFRYWWAGYSYGPRFLTDVVAIAALLLVYALPQNPFAYLRSSTSAALTATFFAAVLLFSVVVQFVGVNSGAAGSEWNAVPLSVDRSPSRVWPITDNQIERNVRAAYFRFFAWNIARSSGYDRGVAARVTAISPSFAQVAKGASIDATAIFSNDGLSRVYGYDSGVYIGQMRVWVRIVDARKRIASEQYLYVQGSPTTAEQTTAVGTLTMPVKPGLYLLECDPVIVGGQSVTDRVAPFRVVVRVS